MGEHRDREPRRGHGIQVEDLVNTLRILERDLVAVLTERTQPPPPRRREYAYRDEDDDYSASDSSSSSSSSSSSDSSDSHEHKGGACRTQLIISGALPVPCEKPDIETVLRMLPVCRVTNWQPVQTADGRKVVVTGVAEIGIEYVAAVPDQPLHFAHFTMPFHTFFLCEKEITEVHCEVEFTHHELLNPRCISKVVLLAVWGA